MPAPPPTPPGMRVRTGRFTKTQASGTLQRSCAKAPVRSVAGGRFDPCVGSGRASPASSGDPPGRNAKALCPCGLPVFRRMPPPRLTVVPYVFVFGPSPPRWRRLGGVKPIGDELPAGTMASADFCRPVPPHRCGGSRPRRQDGRSPGISAYSFAPHLPALPRAGLGNLGFHRIVPAHPPPAAY